MEHQKILNVLNEANEIIYNTEILRSNLCDYNDAYVLVRGDITVIAALALNFSSIRLN